MHVILESDCFATQSSPIPKSLYLTMSTAKQIEDTNQTPQKQKQMPCSVSLYTNVRGLQSSFPEVQLHLHKVTPNPMFLLKTGLSLSIPVQDFTIPGYSSLIVEYDSQDSLISEWIFSSMYDFIPRKKTITNRNEIALSHTKIYCSHCPP